MLVGTVHSGVAMAMAKVAKDSGTLLIVPNAGADAVTGPMCAPNIFRSSFSQLAAGLRDGRGGGQEGPQEGRDHHLEVRRRRRVGASGFKEAFEKGGGKVVKELTLPFPNVEFQALLTEIAATKPDAVYTFFAGGGAVKFVKDYAAAGLKKSIPLYGAGFLTDGTLEAQGADADGLLTTLHYADASDTPRDNAFRLAYAKAYKLQPDVYAVQGYDAAQMLAHRPRRGEGRHQQEGRVRRRGREGEDRQPARRRSRIGKSAQPGAGHLPAPGQRQGEQGDRRGQQGAGRSGPRLQDVDRGAPTPRRIRRLHAQLHVLAHRERRSMDLATFLIQCLNALQYGLLLFLVASGLTLIFGIMGVINLAHGSFYMIGAYMAYRAGADRRGHVRRRLLRRAAWSAWCSRCCSATCSSGPSSASSTSASTCSRC